MYHVHTVTLWYIRILLLNTCNPVNQSNEKAYLSQMRVAAIAPIAKTVPSDPALRDCRGASFDARYRDDLLGQFALSLSNNLSTHRKYAPSSVLR